MPSRQICDSHIQDIEKGHEMNATGESPSAAFLRLLVISALMAVFLAPFGFSLAAVYPAPSGERFDLNAPPASAADAPSVLSEPSAPAAPSAIPEPPRINLPFVGVSVKRSGSFIEVSFPDISKAGEGDDILCWPVFSKAIAAVSAASIGASGVSLKQVHRVGDWRISKSVVFRPSEARLVTSYEFVSAGGIVSARREEVDGVGADVLNLLSAGDFRSVNAMSLRSRIYSGHLPPVHGAWILKP